MLYVEEWWKRGEILGELMLLIHKHLLELMCIPQIIVMNEKACRKKLGEGDVGHMKG